MQEFSSWVGKVPWRRDRPTTPVFMGFPVGSDGNAGWEGPLDKGMWQPATVFLPGEFHEQRSLAGYSPGCHKKSIQKIKHPTHLKVLF